MRWIFVGAGNMASSIIGGLLKGGASADSVTVADPDQGACKRLAAHFKVRTDTALEPLFDTSTGGTAEDAIGIVIAVKPDVVEAVCRDITRILSASSSASIDAPPLIVSVAAGVRATSLQAWLPAGVVVVRCMPNTPALLGLGATALFASPGCTGQQRQQAESLLATAGLTLWVEQESQLDAVTALSGSGPAYFFYLIEHMSAAGRALGLDAETAESLAIETAFGAASMARLRNVSPSVLRENVTSRGGTTAAALQVFDEQDMPAIIRKAMQAAHDRAVEIGDQLAPD